jgi:hypothetical protein
MRMDRALAPHTQHSDSGAPRPLSADVEKLLSIYKTHLVLNDLRMSQVR